MRRKLSGRRVGCQCPPAGPRHAACAITSRTHDLPVYVPKDAAFEARLAHNRARKSRIAANWRMLPDGSDTASTAADARPALPASTHARRAQRRNIRALGALGVRGAISVPGRDRAVEAGVSDWMGNGLSARRTPGNRWVVGTQLARRSPLALRTDGLKKGRSRESLALRPPRCDALRPPQHAHPASSGRATLLAHSTSVAGGCARATARLPRALSRAR